MLWNDICRCPCETEPEWVLSQTQFAVTESAPAWGSSPQRASGWVPSGREAEEVLIGALKITQRGMFKKYEKLWVNMAVCVSLRPSVSLRPQEILTPFECCVFFLHHNKEKYWTVWLQILPNNTRFDLIVFHKKFYNPTLRGWGENYFLIKICLFINEG